MFVGYNKQIKNIQYIIKTKINSTATFRSPVLQAQKINDGGEIWQCSLKLKSGMRCPESVTILC